MVYTQRAPRWQQFHVAPTMQQLNSAVITSVDIETRCVKRQSHNCVRLERNGVCSEAGNFCYYESLRADL